ncbi:formate dehydrogenase subunit delta [Methylobacter sp. YRD-M1]|uniref:formate dehydrogenase subunit delta n=1 Tax=Methylobacter sp. YRD-M1 TaxID=2911520 RepID=UPI00227C7E53|nr:formate dehydrogenase subunit delta [Methylobacter sp. YRD-M1]WAK02085.1 formate dehydrogenase subunit delta [Methylobacter sp. YRD-M1]
MANDIGNFFNSDPDKEAAVDGIFDHLRKFWDPRMRKEIIQYYREGGNELNELVRQAIKRLELEQG